MQYFLRKSLKTTTCISENYEKQGILDTECPRGGSLEIRKETVTGERKLIHETNPYYTVTVEIT